jgi:cell division protein FtsX
VVSETLGMYLQIMLTLFLIGCFTATLTRLVVLIHFIPDEAHPQEMPELVPV